MFGVHIQDLNKIIQVGDERNLLSALPCRLPTHWSVEPIKSKAESERVEIAPSPGMRIATSRPCDLARCQNNLKNTDSLYSLVA